MGKDKDTRLVYEPSTAAHPGETVVEYLEFNGWSQRDLARRTGLTPKTISEICNGKAPITPATALALENVLKRPAHFWLNLQALYDEAEARRQVRSKFQSWKEWADRFPIKELKKYRFLESEESPEAEVGALLGFLGVSSPDSWNSVWKANSVAYRQTRKFRTSEEAISAWVRAAELMAGEIEISEFSEERLRASLGDIRCLSRKLFQKFMPELQEVCAAAGVAVVLVPEMPHTGISGCARWLTDKKAFIGLTLRYKTDDQLWYTFFHEAGHLLLHRKKHGFILDNAAETLTDQVVDPEMQRFEEEANRFAEDIMIPPGELARFIQEGVINSETIYRFSEEIGIGPGLVVGRLQREKLIEYYQGNAFKQKLAGHAPADK